VVVGDEHVAPVFTPLEPVAVAWGLELGYDGACVGVEHVCVERVAGDSELSIVPRALGAGVEVVLVVAPDPRAGRLVQVVHDDLSIEPNRDYFTA
jgi:hypothetical protein